MNRLLASWSLQKKIVYPLVVVSILIAFATYVFFSSTYRTEKEEALVAKARALVMSAESAREYAAQQYTHNVFRKDLKTISEIMYTVPVFAAMKVAEQKADELGMVFRVPKFSPRNPKNQPDAFEADVLRQLESGAQQEYFANDEKTNSIRYFRPIRLTTECLACHGDPATSKVLWKNDQGLDPTGTRMEGWKEGEVHGAFEVQMSLEPVDAAVAAESRWIAGISLLGALGIIIVGFVVMRSVVAPVRHLAQNADQVAQGDLTVTMEMETKDEIGSLADSFNQMVQSLRATIEQVTEASSSVASASSQISSSTEEMAAGARQQTEQAEMVASAVEEMANTIVENSQNAAKTVETAQQAGDAAVEGGKIVEETVEGIKRIAAVVEKTAVTVQELGRSSDQIGEVVSLIEDIADQTNLLALNAAIEAARAGEQGRGFAVVADEVRKLAERTTKATKEIGGMIKKIQQDTQEAVVSMHEGTAQTEAGIKLADKAGRSLKEIVGVSHTVTDMVKQIAVASGQQSTASEQIAKNVESITNVTNETAIGTQQIAKAAEDLNRLTEHLQQLIGQFRVSDHEAGPGPRPAKSASARMALGQ